MGEITIYFVGICTHIRGRVDGVPHRVLLVHEESDVVINGYTIHSHKPSLLAPTKTLAEAPQRVIFAIANSIGGPPSYDDSYRCGIFKLQQVAGQLLELNGAIAIGRQLPASVYFDFQHGKFAAGVVPRTATGVRVTVVTEGDPVLSMTPMDGGGPHIERLPSGAMLFLRNDAVGPRTHQDADFLLHYRAFTNVPEGAIFPTRPPVCHPPLPAFPIPQVELSAGCSNSDYP